MSKRKHLTAKVVAGGALIAAGAGYLAGILTAPKSGKDTRKDIARTASTARVNSEKQLKKLHSEIGDLIDDVDKKTKKTRKKASKELTEAADKAREAKDKARELLSALHDGDADDPNLKAVIDEVKAAKKNLAKYLKK